MFLLKTKQRRALSTFIWKTKKRLGGLFEIKIHFSDNISVRFRNSLGFQNSGAGRASSIAKSMSGESSPFDLIEEAEKDFDPNENVDAMARLAWAATGGGEDCSWSELTRALNLIWRTQVSAADLLAPEHLDLLARKLQVLIAAS